MRRRDFITLLGGAAAWPHAARAQQGERMRRVGVLMNIAADDQEAQLYMAAFQQGLQELGSTVGRNLWLDHRWGPSNQERVRQQVAELIALAPDVILATGGAPLDTLQQVSRTVPVVFPQSIDPVGAGDIASLARPGGNTTGLSQQTTDLAGKRLELLREVRPGLRRLAIMANAGYPGAVSEMQGPSALLH